MTAPTTSEVEEVISRFIFQELLETSAGGTDPLAQGAVDSLGIEQLVEYVFEVWDVELDDDEIIAENFESIPALVSLVASHLERPSPE